jgi:hypothetical protein
MFFFRQAFAVLYKSLFWISLLIFLPTFLSPPFSSGTGLCDLVATLLYVAGRGRVGLVGG